MYTRRTRLKGWPHWKPDCNYYIRTWLVLISVQQKYKALSRPKNTRGTRPWLWWDHPARTEWSANRVLRKLLGGCWSMITDYWDEPYFWMVCSATLVGEWVTVFKVWLLPSRLVIPTTDSTALERGWRDHQEGAIQCFTRPMVIPIILWTDKVTRWTFKPTSQFWHSSVSLHPLVIHPAHHLPIYILLLEINGFDWNHSHSTPKVFLRLRRNHMGTLGEGQVYKPRENWWSLADNLFSL